MSVYVKRTKKNGVHVLTSTYFDDVKMLRESLKDSNVSAMRHNKNSEPEYTSDAGAVEPYKRAL